MRIELSKITKEYDADIQEAIKSVKPEGFDELAQKENKTEEESKTLKKWKLKQMKSYWHLI